MPRLRLKQPLFPVLIAFLIGLQAMDPSRAWTILLVGLTGTFILAYVWARGLGKDIEVRRETRLSWVQVGGQIEERLTLSNAYPLPAAWVEFKDQSTLPGFNASRKMSLGSGYFEQWNATAICHQRGSFHLGGALIRTGDPFGIFEVTINASKRTSILVLPPVANPPDIFIAPSGVYGESQPRRNTIQQTIHAASVREFQHGDSMRMMHWPTTARTAKPFVRLMESAPEGDWWILLDLNHGQLPGTGWDSVEEQSISLAASLTAHGLSERKAVGFIANARELTWISPKKGAGQRWEVLQSLAMVKPGTLSLNALLKRMHPSLGKHHSLIIITASQELDWLATVTPLLQRSIIPTVLLIDLASYGGESAKNTAAALIEHGIKCHVLPRGLFNPLEAFQSGGKGSWQSTPTGEFIPVQLSSQQAGGK